MHDNENKICDLPCSSSALQDRIRLFRDLLQHHDEALGPDGKFVRPSEQVNLSLSFKLEELIDVDTYAQTVTTKVWLYMARLSNDTILRSIYLNLLVFTQEWKNEFLTWNPEEYGNITAEVWQAVSKIWFPDISVYNA